MSILTLVTNVPQEKITSDILKNITQFVSDLLLVPERNVLISISAGVQMKWGVQEGIYALGTIQDTDGFKAEDTKKFAPQIFEYMEKKLGIPQNRMYIGFVSLNPNNIAFGGKLFTAILGE